MIMAFLLFSVSILCLCHVVYQPLDRFHERVIRVKSNTLRTMRRRSSVTRFSDLVERMRRVGERVRGLVDGVMRGRGDVRGVRFRGLLCRVGPRFLLGALGSVR